MKKLGIYGIISGGLILSTLFGLSVVAYLRGLWNLKKFGAEIYMRDLLFKILVDSWWVILYLLLFSIISIVLGILLFRKKERALKVWIAFYGMIAFSCLYGVIVSGITFSGVEFILSTLILILSIRVFKKNTGSNLGL